MTEPAPNKTVSVAGMRPAPTSNYLKTPAPAHHVKKLIETYNKTAERSMAGPASAEDPSELTYKMYSDFHLPHHAQIRSQTYKLPPDVELSKSPTNPAQKTRRSDDCVDEDGFKVHDVPPKKRTVNLDRLHSSGDLYKSECSPTSLNDDFKQLQKNGHVTLSRVGVDCDPGSSQSDNQRAKSCDSSHSGSSGRHLTGEMIRQLQDQIKDTRVPPLQPSLQQQKILDINASMALYEKVLQEKSYLPVNQRPIHHQSGASFKTPATGGPVFLPRDRGHTDLQVTKLAGQEIFCFNIGGEKRLCLPQIINTILVHVSLHEINSVCDELRIFCATCTQDQLSRLKSAKIIPMSAAHSGLITKSDAERLCSIFLDGTPPSASQSGFRAKSSPFSFRVQHFCFGSCIGVVLPEAYTSPTACCIECIECEGLFCPQKFVCHVHRNRERRTCHWGFDSSNWRSYLMLAEDYTQTQRDSLSKSFANFKARYNPTKRKQRDTSPIIAGLTNGIGGSNNCDPIVKEEVKLIDLEGPSQSKRHRIPDLPSHGAMPPAIYQTLPRATGNLKPGTGNALHPATVAAAWSKHISKTQAAKDKDILGLKKSIAIDLAAKSTSLLPPPSQPTNVRNLEQRTCHYPQTIKSSPSPGSDSPLQALDSPSTTPNGGHLLVSSSGQSLAEDIQAIRFSLEGASSNAREKILKILERLTARLAQAEAERDEVLGELRAFQTRFDQIEDELHKKRAELREALQQDGVLVGMKKMHSTNVNGDRIHRAVESVTLEPVHDFPQDNRSDALEDLNRLRYNETSNFSSHKKAFTSVGLPKVDLKIPARIIDEKERLSESPLQVWCKSRSPSPNDQAPSTSSSGSERRMHGRRSGTPASVKSKESEDLKERMLTMESELRALREELTHRPPAKRPRSLSTDGHVVQAVEWQNHLGKLKSNTTNGMNGGDHALKVLSNGSTLENINEKLELEPNSEITIKAEHVDVFEVSVTDKENSLVNENNE